MNVLLFLNSTVLTLALASASHLTVVSGAMKRIGSAKNPSYAIQEVPLDGESLKKTRRYFKLEFKRHVPPQIEKLREDSLIQVQGKVKGEKLIVENDADVSVIAALEEGSP